MAINKTATQNIREKNEENLTDVRNGARASFTEILDTLQASYRDKVKVTLKETDKSKIMAYYKRWIYELRENKRNVIFGYIFATVLMYYFTPFEIDTLKHFTNNEVLYKGAMFLLLYALGTVVLAFMMVEKNIERFFTHLYPYVGSCCGKNEKLRAKILAKVLFFLFSEEERKETDFKPFVFAFVPLLVFMFFAENLQIFVTVVTMVWVVLAMFHSEKNNVFWRKK